MEKMFYPENDYIRSYIDRGEYLLEFVDLFADVLPPAHDGRQRLLHLVLHGSVFPLNDGDFVVSV